MRKLKVSIIGISAFLLAVLMVGCGGDADTDCCTGLPGDPLTAPTVTFVTPPNASTLICPNTAVITATFSKAMNPATINISTFTLTGPGGASVGGTVTYAVATNIATFTPTVPLAASTTFTATITTGVADTFGNHMKANFVWTFTTSGPCGPAPILLGATLCSFGVLGATPVVSNTGLTIVTGNVGISPACALTGWLAIDAGPGTITGTFHTGVGCGALDDGVAPTAQGELTVAFNAAAGAAGGAILPADIGGQTLPPGVYRTNPAGTLAITGDLTLDGGGDPNSTWIFQIESSLTTAAGLTAGVPNSRVLLQNGATSNHVFWQVGSSATLGTDSIFAGTIMAQASVTLGTNATLNGRALARTGAVTLDSNQVNVPPCP